MLKASVICRDYLKNSRKLRQSFSKWKVSFSWEKRAFLPQDQGLDSDCERVFEAGPEAKTLKIPLFPTQKNLLRRRRGLRGPRSPGSDVLCRCSFFVEQNLFD